jgi:hypothetical protein
MLDLGGSSEVGATRADKRKHQEESTVPGTPGNLRGYEIHPVYITAALGKLSFLARLFSEKTSRYCHSSIVGVVVVVVVGVCV